ncbi:N-acetylglutaminylglutamine amidotransferase [Acuticoccus yangtzensis]|uniref:N-acetylglutaminylglutamine amidotransferase n=1 Tax=Acuticoccus yangtzensis TaxID=1443441 RepID=UPI000949A2FC|nr:N-acetylglutaminylglutamine amidotransferase [Acuticoccus yangtzensis]
MCGICGEVRFDGQSASVPAVIKMADAMAPRGPDGAGILARDRFAFGHRRLTIIDLSVRSAQPMTDPELGLSIVFNGCIYNYPELRAELEGKGYRFFSSGDTEVILKAYHAWGTECVKRFHGMFAFVIHERDSQRVVMGRDRFGIKPFYYAEGHKRIRFASSLQALLAAGDVDTSIDPVALNHYMSFHAVVPPPRTILNGVRKLPPATVRVVEPDGTSKDTVYWRVDYGRSADDLKVSGEEWRDRVMAALKLAVDRRMVADVPVGVLLSGGVDSSVIVALLAQAGQKDLKTFSIGFEDAHGEVGNEFEFSDIIAKRFATDHHRIHVSSREMIEELPNAVNAMPEPMVSYDNIGFFLLSREVAKSIKVVQSGQGADEIFGGYHWYPPMASANDPLAAYSKAFFDRDYARMKAEISAPYLADHDAALDFVREQFAIPGADDPVDKALRIDSTVMLVDDPVKRVDAMTMAWGLEARVPFLDHELCELAARIPPEHKLKENGKGVLKDVARQLVPHEIIDRKKGYFPVPALKYISDPVKEMVEDVLGASAAKTRGLFNPAYLDKLLADPPAHITPLRGSELWQVALLEMWLQSHRI